MNNQLLPGPVEIARILEFLPHRYPFLLIDRVLTLEMEPQKRLTGLKNVTINEPFFQGHFPTNPVMPGVLIIEAMAQAAGMLAYLAAETKGEKGELYYLTKVDRAKFNRVIIPGDQVIQFPFFTLGFSRQVRQHAGCLGHGLNDQHAGHYRIRRKVTLEKRLIEGHILEAGKPFLGFHFEGKHPVKQQKWVSVRQEFENPGNLHRAGQELIIHC